MTLVISPVNPKGIKKSVKSPVLITIVAFLFNCFIRQPKNLSVST